jgi:hypothetical protein
LRGGAFPFRSVPSAIEPSPSVEFCRMDLLVSMMEESRAGL